MSEFLLAEAPTDIAALRDKLLKPEVGGFCCFEGWVRQTNEGRSVSGIEYLAFASLAASDRQTILDEALPVLTSQRRSGLSLRDR